MASVYRLRAPYTGAVDGSPADVTDLLLRWGTGDNSVLTSVTPVIHDDLRRAARALSRGQPVHTVQVAAMVRECYLRLVDPGRVQWQNRAHFLGAAATIVRRVLVDYARARGSGERGRSALRIAIEDDVALVPGVAEDVLAVDDALTALADLDPRKVRVAQMKCFAAMAHAEIAEVLGVSEATAERDWSAARAWLANRLHPVR
jgi:RNA polymerase sigma factor (TIGR02999 family)